MPLFEMSANIQESEPTGRKRSHDDYAGDIVKVDGLSGSKAPVVTGSIRPGIDCLLSPFAPLVSQSSPQSSPALTEAGSTPARKSLSPETPTKSALQEMMNGAKQQQVTTGSSSIKSSNTSNPAAKRQRVTLSAAEKEARDKEAEERRKEREEKAAIKLVEKAKAEEEKIARVKEREEKRKKKEEEDREKQKEREEKKRKKEEEQQRIQEEKDKKARQQPTLSSFFSIPTTPKKAVGEVSAKTISPVKDSTVTANSKPKSRYEAMFKPFFVKKDTRLAPSPTQMDDETRDAKSRILDEFISGKRKGKAEAASFDPFELFTPLGREKKRGHLHHPVKHIMEQVDKETDKSGSEVSQVIIDARTKLAIVPMKVIAFSQDVRPPYYGTVTFKPFILGQGIMSRLARRSMGRRLPLDYDYDSEAEWQDEEGEDLDGDDDEEELEDEDDMDGFLDDSEDVGPARIFGNSVLQPQTTGICFENDHHVGPDQSLDENAMEFMHEGLEHSWGIDPFSTQYWEPEPKAKPTKAVSSGEKAAKMPPPPAPVNAFAALAVGAAPGGRPEKMVKTELLNDVKQAILANKLLSKVGIVDFIFHQFRDAVSRTEVKNTVEYVAEKKGAGRSKEWVLKPGHEVST